MIQWRTMSLLRGGTGACTFRRHTVEVVFMALVLFQSSELALGQSPTVFQYGRQFQVEGPYGELLNTSLQVPNAPDTNITELQDTDLRCGRDFNIVDHSLVLTTARSTTGNISGTCFYNPTVQLNPSCGSSTVNSFGVMFQVAIIANISSALDHGLAFFLMADNSTQDEDQDCWHLNSTSNDQASSNGHCFTVFEVNFFQDLEGYYMGSDQNVTRFSMRDYSPFLRYYDSGSFALRVWAQYLGDTRTLEVYMIPYGFSGGLLTNVYKPHSPIFSTPIDLTERFSNGLSTLLVGFSASISNSLNSSASGLDTYNSVKYRINKLTFNSNGFAPDFVLASSTTQYRSIGPSDHPVVAAIVISVSMFLFPVYMVIFVFYRRNTRLIALGKKYEIEHGILDRGPQKFKYAALKAATKGFSSNQLLGTGGFGSVYKANLVLKGDKSPSEVAVKRISSTSSQGAQEFLAEVRIIGQAQHRNLVRLLGWCHEKGELLLVYDYMPNGSVDQHLFRDTNDAAGDPILTWSRRLRIVSGVAAALTYLHEEWEKRVFHRDVKCSNVMLDSDFNARLGDFGLARLSEHDTAPRSTELAGTRGYMAPELFYTYKATEKTDVYSFGAMVLEVATGKKCILSAAERHGTDHILLVDWVWDLYRDDTLLDAADCGLQNAFDQGEMSMFLKIGLLCSHPDPNERPCMRDVVNIWKGISSFPPLPLSKPVPFESLAMDAPSDVLGLHSGSTGGSTLGSTPTGHSTLTMPSIIEDGESIPAEKPDVQEDSDSRSTLRFRARTIASLPY